MANLHGTERAGVWPGGGLVGLPVVVTLGGYRCPVHAGVLLEGGPPRFRCPEGGHAAYRAAPPAAVVGRLS
jgi:hypothetical protein